MYNIIIILIETIIFLLALFLPFFELGSIVQDHPYMTGFVLVTIFMIARTIVNKKRNVRGRFNVTREANRKLDKAFKKTKTKW